MSGGRCLSSSVLMNCSGEVAGVENIVVTVPPAGEASDMVLAALHLGGADQGLVLAVPKPLGHWPTAPKRTESG